MFANILYQTRKEKSSEVKEFVLEIAGISGITAETLAAYCIGAKIWMNQPFPALFPALVAAAAVSGATHRSKTTTRHFARRQGCRTSGFMISGTRTPRYCVTKA